MTAQAKTLQSHSYLGTPPAGANHGRVAYVMNGYPRLSETFITHEIYQLERMGLQL